MDAFFIQILNGLDKGSAYALIALGLTLIFGTLGVVNFAHGALFMIGAFCAVTMQRILSLSSTVIDETQKDFLGNPLKVEVPYVESWFGPNLGGIIQDWSVPLSIFLVVPVMLFVGYAMERGLIKHFYKRPHADQILVTFGLAIVIGEIIKAFYGANPIQTPMPSAFVGTIDIGPVAYPTWRLVYFFFSAAIIAAVFAFLQFTTFGMVVRAGMADRRCDVHTNPITTLQHRHGLPCSVLRCGCCRRHGQLARRRSRGLPAGYLAVIRIHERG